MYCDELGLLSLSALYHRHVLVLTSNKLWSTIEKAITDEETVRQPTASPTNQVVNTAPASAECVETKNNDALPVQTDSSEVNNNSVHVGTKNKTGHVETNTTEQNSRHVETPSVLHVVTTDSTLTPNKNAAVPVSTENKVVSATPMNKVENVLDAPVPTPDSNKDYPPARNVF